MSDYQLSFDGRSLSLSNQGGDVIKSWNGVSGAPGHQKPSEQSINNVGPLPEGNWNLSIDNAQSLSFRDTVLGIVGRGAWPGSVRSWGEERAFLDALPGTQTFGRKDFSIHGGWTWGSRGCIDLGEEETDFFATLRALGIHQISLSVSYDPLLETQPHPLAGLSTTVHCFPKGTLISTIDGVEKIENISIGTLVRAFDGSNEYQLRRVSRVFQNITTEWLILSCGLTVTPGHRFLNEFNAFERIDDLITRSGMIVLEDGTFQSVTAERIVYSEKTRHLYEEVEELVNVSAGNNALKPQVCRGWRTYNFEVEDLHTYIAGGVRVHNDSLQDYLGLSALMLNDAYVAVAATEISNRWGEHAIASAAYASASFASPNYGGYLSDMVGAYEAAVAIGDFKTAETIRAGLDNVIATGIGPAKEEARLAMEQNPNSTTVKDFKEKFDIYSKAYNDATHALNKMDGVAHGRAPGSAIGGALDGVMESLGSIVGEVLGAVADVVGGVMGAIGDALGGLFGGGSEETSGADAEAEDGSEQNGSEELSTGSGPDAEEDNKNLPSQPLVIQNGQTTLTTYANGTILSEVSKHDGQSFAVFKDLDVMEVGEITTLSNGWKRQEITTAMPNDEGVQKTTTFYNPSDVMITQVITVNNRIRFNYKRNSDGSSSADTYTDFGAPQLQIFIEKDGSGWQWEYDYDKRKRKWVTKKTYFNKKSEATYALLDLGKNKAGRKITEIQSYAADHTLTKNIDNLTLLENAKNGTGNDKVNQITGNDVGNSLSGAAGDDIIKGQGGDDILDGGTGADMLNGGNGDDTLQGGVGNDTLNGEADRDVLQGGEGDDTLNGGGGADTLYGEAGADSLDGSTGDDTLSGGDGNDRLDGGAWDDRLNGDAGDDTLSGGDDYDTLLGGAGNDWLDGGNGMDSLDGGDGVDTLIGGGGIDNLHGGAGTDWLDGGINDDIVYGDDGNDTLLGGDGRDELHGGEGDDSLVGGIQQDWLVGDAGQDTLSGESGDDGLYGAAGQDSLIGADGNDTLEGGADNDTLDGGLGDDRMRGDAGDDILYGRDGRDDLDGGDGNDNLSGEAGNDALLGSDGNDTLSGGTGDDALVGDAGDDILHGEAGNDVLKGGLGADSLFGEAGDDSLYGGAGIDTLLGADGDDQIYGDDGDDTIDGGLGADKLWGGDGQDTIDGGDGDDVLTGDAGNDSLVGGLGDDMLAGSAGDDTLVGGIGHDQLFGGDGNDSLIGGADVDLIDGGAGTTDVIVLTGLRTDYEIRFNTAIGRYSIVDKRAGSPDGTDFANVEIFQFSDGLFTVADLNYMTGTDAASAWDVLNVDGSKNRMGWEADPLDPAKLQTFIEHYNLAGERISRTEFKEDGSRLAYAWDRTPDGVGPDWRSYVMTYDTKANLIREVYEKDDDTYRVVERNPNDYLHQEWIIRETKYSNKTAYESDQPFFQEDTLRNLKDGVVAYIQREWDYTAGGWSEILRHLDGLKRALWERTNNDDGSYTIRGEDHDQNGSNYLNGWLSSQRNEEWATFVENYNADGDELSELYTYYGYPNGPVFVKPHSVEKVWDRAGQENWSSWELEYEGTGLDIRNTLYTIYYDTEPTFSKYVKQWDYSGQTWSTEETWYDKAVPARPISQEDKWIDDNGTLNRGISRRWDYTGIEWTKYEAYYRTATTNVYKEIYWYDNGYYSVTEHDLYGEHSDYRDRTIKWTDTSLAVEAYESTTYDDGASMTHEWDRAGARDWDEIVTTRDSGNLHVTQTTTYDLKDRYKKVEVHEWDYTPKAPWKEQITTFDDGKDWNRIEQIISDNEKTIQYRDVFDGNDWDTKTEYYKNQKKVKIEVVLDTRSDHFSTRDTLKTGNESWDWKHEEFAKKDFTQATAEYLWNKDGSSVTHLNDPLGSENYSSQVVIRGTDNHHKDATTFYDAGEYAGLKFVDHWEKTGPNTWVHTQVRYASDGVIVGFGSDNDSGWYPTPYVNPFNTSLSSVTSHPADPNIPFGSEATIVYSSEFYSTKGNDTIVASKADDVFVFQDKFGHDIVSQFNGGPGVADVIQFRTSTFANWNAVLAAATQKGDDVLITAEDHSTLLLKNITLARLNADDFRFVS